MIDRYSLLLREIEMEIGTRDLNTLILESLRDTINAYDGKTMEGFIHQIEEVLHIFTDTKPKFAIVIDNFYQFLDEAKHCVPENTKSYAFADAKECLLNIVSRLIQKGGDDREALLEQVRTLDFDGKTILIHDHSHSVQDALWELKKAGQEFQVIVAEQDHEKTLSNIELLTEREIPFHTVPAYMLSNIEQNVDACFFGCLTLKSTFDFVSDTGTSAIVSQCRLRKVPIYMFLNTSKFALWKAEKKEVIHHRATKKHPHKEIHFERLKFSHDRVPLASVDYVVTEKGVHTAREVRHIYEHRLKDRMRQEKERSKN